MWGRIMGKTQISLLNLITQVVKKVDGSKGKKWSKSKITILHCKIVMTGSQSNITKWLTGAFVAKDGGQIWQCKKLLDQNIGIRKLWWFVAKKKKKSVWNNLCQVCVHQVC